MSLELRGIKFIHIAVTAITTSISRTFSSSQTDTLSPSNPPSPSLRPHRPLPVSGFDCSGASYGWNSHGLCPLPRAFGQHHVFKAHLCVACVGTPVPFKAEPGPLCGWPSLGLSLVSPRTWLSPRSPIVNVIAGVLASVRALLCLSGSFGPENLRSSLGFS